MMISTESRSHVDIDAALYRHKEWLRYRATEAMFLNRGACPEHGTELVNLFEARKDDEDEVPPPQARCPRLKCDYVTPIEPGSNLAKIMVLRP